MKWHNSNNSNSSNMDNMDNTGNTGRNLTRQELIEMAQGNGETVKTVKKPDGSTEVVWTLRHNGYTRIYHLKDMEEYNMLQNLMHSDL